MSDRDKKDAPKTSEAPAKTSVAPQVTISEVPEGTTSEPPLTVTIDVSEPPPAKLSGAPVTVTSPPDVSDTAITIPMPPRVIEVSAKVSEAPAKVSEAPAKVSEAPAKVSEAPAKVSEAPAKVSEAPKVAAKAAAAAKAEVTLAEDEPALLLAEFDSPAEVLHAAEALHAAGYKDFDTHTPFPIHGMDAAMGLGDSKLGLIVFPIGLTGTTIAFSMIHWMNNIDYQIIIGGKPASVASLPSMIPIMFELTILLSAFAAVFGMLGLNKLPRHHHPVFNSDRFRAFSNDKFFVSVEATDPKWNVDKTKSLLERAHAKHIELLYDDEEGGEDLDPIGTAKGHA